MGCGRSGCAWRLALCCHVLFQKVLLRANVLCRNGLNLGPFYMVGQDGEGLSRFWGRILDIRVP